jgi:flavin reductase (DIM6/NTAB) family NADH-FMN oxidoreductase RutF
VAAALGRIPSGCFILTTGGDGDATAMLASWVQQASFDPPAITAAVRKGRHAERVVDATGHFVLNLVGEDPGPMFKHFGKGFGPGEEAFTGLNVERREAGVVLADCPVHLACKVTAKHDAGDHWLYLAEVLGADGDATAKPYVHLRKNGLSY